MIRLLIALLPLTCFADTVEFIRGGTVQATVTMAGDKFTIQATFANGGKREIVVERRFIYSVEINRESANDGAAPANFGKFTEAEAERFEINTADVLRLNDGEKLRGRVQAISAATVRFNGEEIARSDVKDLLLGSAVLSR